MMINLFFFQAEDGIRDSSVTGVQTCALPISPPAACPCAPGNWSRSCRRSFSAPGPHAPDRKSVVEGKSVDLGGRRIIKKKTPTCPARFVYCERCYTSCCRLCTLAADVLLLKY